MTHAEKAAIEAECDSLRRHVAMLLAGCTPLPAVLACARRLVARLERLEARLDEEKALQEWPKGVR